MALLKKDDSLFGIKVDTYSRIKGVNIVETGEDANGKLYAMSVMVDKHVSSKSGETVNNTCFEFKDLRESDLSLASAYMLLMTTDEYSDAVFA